MQRWMPAGARVASNGTASTSTATTKLNGSPATPSVAAPEQRFQAAVGRESPEVAQVALDPAATLLLDLNAATFQGDDPNRIRLRDLILNDGEPLAPEDAALRPGVGMFQSALGDLAPLIFHLPILASLVDIFACSA